MVGDARTLNGTGLLELQIMGFKTYKSGIGFSTTDILELSNIDTTSPYPHKGLLDIRVDAIGTISISTTGSNYDNIIL